VNNLYTLFLINDPISILSHGFIRIYSFYIDLTPKLKLQSNIEGSVEFYNASITFGFNSFKLSSETKYASPFPTLAALLIKSLLHPEPIPNVNNFVES
jgi:hypothetical protein